MYEIETRLGFISIDDSRRADLEVALGLLQLLTYRLFLRLRHLQIYFSQQNVKICLRHAQDQVLGRNDELRIRLRNLKFGLFINRKIFLADKSAGLQ